jgi:type II secretory pathway pseudopilin PulG
MSTRRLKPSRPRGHSLVELLVVLAIIIVVTSGAAWGWGRGSRARSLEAGQRLVSSALMACRTHAALAQTDVLLVVEAADPAHSTYLRELRLFCPTSSADGWGPPRILLPPGVHVVPPSESGLIGAPPGATWPPARTSSLLSTSDPDTPSGYRRIARFTANGELLSGAGTLVVGAAAAGPVFVRFEDPAASRGVWLSRYGVAQSLSADLDAIRP